MDLSGPGIDVKFKERKKESYKCVVRGEVAFLIRLRFDDVERIRV
jgi:hypothetical protein